MEYIDDFTVGEGQPRMKNFWWNDGRDPGLENLRLLPYRQLKLPLNDQRDLLVWV